MGNRKRYLESHGQQRRPLIQTVSWPLSRLQAVPHQYCSKPFPPKLEKSAPFVRSFGRFALNFWRRRLGTSFDEKGKTMSISDLEDGDVLMDDGAIAQCLKVSKSCIRGQRHRRRNGLDHWFTVDPLYIGTCPRYLATEFRAWLREREVSRKQQRVATEVAARVRTVAER